jgi:hypothetical protein
MRSTSLGGGLIGALWALASTGAFAQGRDAKACFPACREGYVCNGGQCVSMCNPPCPSDQVCIEGRRCDLPVPAQRPIFEPPPPLQKTFEDRRFFMMAFHYGFGGNVEANGAETSADSTIGFNLRGDVPIERYLLIGPLLQFGAWRADVTPTPSRNFYIDLSLFLRGRIPITTESANFQIWAGVPVGVTFDILGQSLAGASDVGLGWNVGVSVGGAVHFTPRFGMFAELGWLQHKMHHSGDQTGPGIDFRVAQQVLNLGFVFRD